MTRYIIAPVFWALIILFFSVIPTAGLPDFSFWTLLTFDKLIHVCMYGVLSFQVMKSCVRQYANRMLRYNAIRFTVIVCTVYGGLIELLQEFYLTERFGSWMDMIANIVGIIAGIIIFRIIFAGLIR